MLIALAVSTASQTVAPVLVVTENTKHNVSENPVNHENMDGHPGQNIPNGENIALESLNEEQKEEMINRILNETEGIALSLILMLRHTEK